MRANFVYQYFCIEWYIWNAIRKHLDVLPAREVNTNKCTEVAKPCSYILVAKRAENGSTILTFPAFLGGKLV